MTKDQQDTLDQEPEDDAASGPSPWARHAGKPSDPPAPTRRRKWLRRAGRGAAVVAIAIPALWYAIHEIPGFGPAVVDGVRAVVGPGPIAWAEDTAYAVADRLNLLRYGDAPPKTFWAPPPPSPAPGGGVVTASATEPAAAAPPDAFAPARFDPPFDRVAAEGDGVWAAMADAVAPRDPPVLWKSVVHPDPRRGFAAVAIVAIDLTRVDLRLVAGTQEPASSTVPVDHRPGIVPADQTPDLLAAFNGGFKAMHGNYGMMLGGETFLPPRDFACTVALYKAGPIRIRTWKALKDSAPDMLGFRQTPACLIEQGDLNAALSESNRNWGATVSGETIIRRSAIGLDERGRVLFYGLGEAVTSASLARAMKAAGAFDAAQLDVNYSYPRFLVYEKGAPGDPPHAASSLIPDVKFKPAEYVGEPSPRDFFYLVRKRTTS